MLIYFKIISLQPLFSLVATFHCTSIHPVDNSAFVCLSPFSTILHTFCHRIQYSWSRERSTSHWWLLSVSSSSVMVMQKHAWTASCIPSTVFRLQPCVLLVWVRDPSTGNRPKYYQSSTSSVILGVCFHKRDHTGPGVAIGKVAFWLHVRSI